MATELKVAFIDFPPYTHLEEGKPAGQTLATLGKVAAAAGYTLTHEQFPVARVVDALERGTHDLTILTASPFKDKAATVASGTAVVDRLIMEAFAIGKPPAIAAKEDLKGKTIVVNFGYGYGGWRAFIDDPANGVKIGAEPRSADLALAALLAGRGELLLHYRTPVAKALAQKPIDGLQSKTLLNVPIFFHVSKKRADADATLAKLEATLKELRGKGTIEAEPAS